MYFLVYLTVFNKIILFVFLLLPYILFTLFANIFINTYFFHSKTQEYFGKPKAKANNLFHKLG